VAVAFLVDVGTPATKDVAISAREFSPLVRYLELLSSPFKRTPVLEKRRDPVQYQNENPMNEIPDFIVCNALDGSDSAMYSHEEIWAALERGFDVMQGREPYLRILRRPQRYGLPA
jgi:hypothetical protein